jgi:hypothetical protein
METRRETASALYQLKLGHGYNKAYLFYIQETASAFYQLKLGHGYNKAYLFCIGKADSLRCSCRVQQTLEHLLFSCKWLRQDHKILRHDLSNSRLTLPLLLNTKQGIQATEHQLFKVSKRSISIDFLPLSILNAFLNSIPNVFSLLQALWQAHWPFIAADGFVTPPTVDVPDTTNTRTSQPAWPHRHDLGRGR